MKNLTLALALLLAAAFLSCGGNSQHNQQNGQQSAQAAEQPPSYPSIPMATVQMLFEKCDYIDYLFYYTNFSVSQKTKPDIQRAISHIAAEPPVIHSNCKPIGRVFYQAEGESLLEADLYFDEKCIYFLFMEDGKPAYANRMMPNGIAFFNQIMQHAKQ